ncbi:MAG: GNAT family N-acetyltransferase [Bacteroidia bacterium]
MLREINLEETLPVRSAALRKGANYDKCYVPEDNMEGSFHIGYEQGEKMLAVASFYPVSLAEKEGAGYQLRLMGVLPELQQQGFGRLVLLEGIEKVKQQNAQYLWCNAREVAVPFYEKIGFVISSPSFDIPNIGLHYQMCLVF